MMDNVEEHCWGESSFGPRILIITEDLAAFQERRAVLRAYRYDLMVASPDDALSLLETVSVDYVAVDLPSDSPVHAQMMRRVENRLGSRPIIWLREDPAYCNVHYLLHVPLDAIYAAKGDPEVLALQRIGERLRDENERLVASMICTGYEWRDILTRIFLAAAYLRHDATQPLTARQAEAVERIEAAAQGIRDIAESYLAGSPTPPC